MRLLKKKKRHSFGSHESFIRPSAVHRAQLKAVDPVSNSGARTNTHSSQSKKSTDSAFVKSTNENGMPKKMKRNAENLSGIDLSDVNVHYNSTKPNEVDALAYAQGNDIHLGAGQEKHLPHELWHVVQQRQGKVGEGEQESTIGNINANPELEAEADSMGNLIENTSGKEVKGSELRKGQLSNDGTLQPKNKVPTNFGEFETTQFDNYEKGREAGVEIILKFHPDEEKVDAKKIGLSQSVNSKNTSGESVSIDPNTQERMVEKGKDGEGYAIDRLSDRNSPIYGDDSATKAGSDLSDTPVADDPKPKLGENTNYELGHCYKKKPEDPKKEKKSAGLYDLPKDVKNKGIQVMFETTALALDGSDKNKYYGSVEWGYKIEGTKDDPKLTTLDIKEVSKGDPSANFIEAAKLWNDAKTRGTYKVSTDPEAVVDLHVVSGGKTTYSELKLAKGTELKQLSTMTWGSDQAITAEVLSGPNKGDTIDIRNKDVVDAGDGSPNKKLPIPTEKKKD